MPEAQARAHRGPPAAISVALEFARALGSLALFPFRLAKYLFEHRRLRAELLIDLASSPRARAPESAARCPRAPRIFLSCAEPSGETHALNTLRALRERCRKLGLGEPEVSGLGGARLREAGVRTIGDPVRKAAMGFSAVLGSLPFYVRLLHSAAAQLRAEQPDVCVFIDSPALHVPLGRIARRAGVPVVHFVTPQHWGWAPWRAQSYRNAVDRALTILPFEEAWFARRGVSTVHVGHPLLDALADVPGGNTDENSRTIALLPGSRRKVIERNLPWMLARLAELRADFPGLEVVLPHGHPEFEALLRAHVHVAGADAWVRLETGDLHRSLRGARAAFSVSGTVLLDLLHHRLPTVVVYRLGGRSGPGMADDVAQPAEVSSAKWLYEQLLAPPICASIQWMHEHLLTPPWFASINLLAAREVVPEFCFAGDGPLERVRTALKSALGDPAWRAECRRGLDLAAERLGPRGACARAAEEVLALAAARISYNEGSA